MSNLTLEQHMERMEAVHEVQNLVGRYEFWHVANLHRKCLQLFALDTPGVKIEMDWGVYDGKESVKRFFLGYHGIHEAENPENDLRGEMHMHLQTTPVIEIAEDLRTAKGVWISPGLESGPFGGDMNAVWSWNKYGVDFVKEDDEWRFWHFHLYRIFKTPYDKSWVDVPYNPPPPQTDPDKRPDKPSSYDRVYSPTAVTENIPEPPAPYETWDDTKAY